MTFQIEPHPSFVADLERLRSGNQEERSAYACWIAVLGELNGLQRPEEVLFGRKGEARVGAFGEYEVYEWQGQNHGAHARDPTAWYRKGAWALKLLWTRDETQRAARSYRMIYVYSTSTRTFHLMALAPRSWNFDQSSPLTERIRRDTNGL